jgi:pilus assembly protein CpaB
MVQGYAWQVRKQAQGGELKRVLVATEDLTRGQKLSEDSLGVMEVPADYVDSRRVLAADRSDIVGVPTQNGLKAGDALSWDDLADGAARRHLASFVTQGKRAYRLNPSSNSLGSLLKVGDHVDVMLERKGQVEVILERVLVLAVGSEVQVLEDLLIPPKSRDKGVTLSLEPSQAATLLGAESKGEIKLVLRNPEDMKKLVQTGEAATSPASPRSQPAASVQEIEHVR